MGLSFGLLVRLISLTRLKSMKALQSQGAVRVLSGTPITSAFLSELTPFERNEANPTTQTPNWYL